MLWSPFIYQLSACGPRTCGSVSACLRPMCASVTAAPLRAGRLFTSHVGPRYCYASWCRAPVYVACGAPLLLRLLVLVACLRCMRGPVTAAPLVAVRLFTLHVRPRYCTPLGAVACVRTRKGAATPAPRRGPLQGRVQLYQDQCVTSPQLETLGKLMLYIHTYLSPNIHIYLTSFHLKLSLTKQSVDNRSC